MLNGHRRPGAVACFRGSSLPWKTAIVGRAWNFGVHIQRHLRCNFQRIWYIELIPEGDGHRDDHSRAANVGLGCKRHPIPWFHTDAFGYSGPFAVRKAISRRLNPLLGRI